jgi:hypothetical protein
LSSSLSPPRPAISAPLVVVVIVIVIVVVPDGQTKRGRDLLFGTSMYLPSFPPFPPPGNRSRVPMMAVRPDLGGTTCTTLPLRCRRRRVVVVLVVVVVDAPPPDDDDCPLAVPPLTTTSSDPLLLLPRMMVEP